MRDVPGLLALLEPLEEKGILVNRTKEMLERDVHRFVVIERDGMIVGCAAIYPYAEEKMAEIACVAVHPTYQGTGRGDQMIEYCERLCKEQGVERIFVLTTQTSHWFRELGFAPSNVRALPKVRRASYDKRRRSKVLVKAI
jgi:amino-acid N-acetyltransferase